MGAGVKLDRFEVLPAPPLSHGSPGRCGKGPQRLHELPEFRVIQRLFSIGQRDLGLGMDLYDEAVRTGRDGTVGEGVDQIPAPGPMTGIGDDRKVGFLLQKGDRGQVEGIAGGGFEGPDSPLAEHDVRVSLAHDVFRRQKKVLHRR